MICVSIVEKTRVSVVVQVCTDVQYEESLAIDNRRRYGLASYEIVNLRNRHGSQCTREPALDLYPADRTRQSPTREIALFYRNCHVLQLLNEVKCLVENYARNAQ